VVKTARQPPPLLSFLTQRRPKQEKAHSWEVEVIKCTEKLATAARERSEMKRAEAEARDSAARVQVRNACAVWHIAAVLKKTVGFHRERIARERYGS
jgi:hypothetical protein